MIYFKLKVYNNYYAIYVVRVVDTVQPVMCRVLAVNIRYQRINSTDPQIYLYINNNKAVFEWCTYLGTHEGISIYISIIAHLGVNSHAFSRLG